jgi:proline iminopeptidase
VALFERLGGPEVGALARRRFLDVDRPRSQADVDDWRKLAFPLYMRTPRDPHIGSRTVGKPKVGLRWFAKPGGESHSFNVFPDLHRIQCPALVLGGEDDPMHPIESRRISQPRCRHTSCGSNGLRIAGTPWCPMRPNPPWL